MAGKRIMMLVISVMVSLTNVDQLTAAPVKTTMRFLNTASFAASSPTNNRGGAISNFFNRLFVNEHEVMKASAPESLPPAPLDGIPHAIVEEDINSNANNTPSISITNGIELASEGAANRSPVCQNVCEYPDNFGVCRKDIDCLDKEGDIDGDSAGRVEASIIKLAGCPTCYSSDFSGKCRLMITCFFQGRGAMKPTGGIL